MGKQIIVVGAGLAGLTAAIYAQRSGFDVTLIEQHSIPGGMSTSWKRKGYLFEGGIHWMTGSSPKTEAYQMWKETGALGENVNVLLHDPFRSVEWEGQTLHIYRDIDKTAEHLLAVSPADEKPLRQMVKDVKAASKMQMPVFDVKGLKAAHPHKMGLGFMLKMLPAMPVMGRMGKITISEYTSRFHHPGIRSLLDCTGEGPATNLIFTLATLQTGDGGYPEGGSLPMTQRIAKTFTDLGGKLLLGAKVQKVNVEGGKATGVTLADGTALPADAVIVAQETVAALDKLFDKPPQDAWLKEVYALKSKSSVCTFVSIGVRAELPDGALPEWKLETPVTYADRSMSSLGFNSYRQYAPEGGTALTTFLGGDTYDFWKKAKDEGRYEQEKQAVADQITRALCAKYPQCEGKIEVIDVATPLTYERYTGAYHGAWMSEMQTGDKMKTYPGTCEDISGLYFAGHRLMPPGGMPSAAASGRQAAQLVCRQFDVVFR